MKQITREEAIGYLRNTVAETLPPVLRDLCGYVLGDSAFAKAPGSSGHHHAFAGGLALHTAEVLRNCRHLMNNPDRPIADGGINHHVVTVAAVWHDYRKTHEYLLSDTGEIDKQPYRLTIGHVVGGAMVFEQVAISARVDRNTRDAILHCMLAHHGRTEWRSPVEPQTPEAWVLHSADMLSARPGGGA